MRVLLAAFAVFSTASLPAAALDLTPAQSEGPYYPRKKPVEVDADLTRIGTGPVAKGDILNLRGAVLDPAGRAIEGARVEIWQTDAKGIYFHPDDPRMGDRDRAFQFFGATTSAADGAFVFKTIIPAAYPGRPRHIHAKITPPGGATLTTQFYFADDAALMRDGIARRLGKALDSVTLKPVTSGDGLDASITVVVPRGAR
jgi:protocatechuate 3,4-dioxygenase beta subunit